MSNSNDSAISEVRLIHVPLSTGDMTIGVALKTKAGIIEWDASPQGTTTGKYDPILLDPTSAEKAFNNLRRFLIGKSILEQRKIDEGILNILGETDTGIKGANLSIAASCAVARAGAVYTQKPLFLWLSEIYNTSPRIPRFMCNMLGGGGHHENNMNITELMIMSKLGKNIPLEKFLEFRSVLQKYISKTDDSGQIGMEGCLIPRKLSDQEAISLLIELLKENCLNESIVLGIDFAGKQSTDKYIEDLLNNFTEIFYIEDPFPICEKEKFVQLTRRFPGRLIAGDDITAGNTKKIQDALSDKIINAVVIKLNHAGTITRISECVETASKEGVIKICSQRSRETGKDTLSHIALSFGFDYLKNGSPVRERVNNYSNIVALSPFIGKKRSSYQ